MKFCQEKRREYLHLQGQQTQSEQEQRNKKKTLKVYFFEILRRSASTHKAMFLDWCATTVVFFSCETLHCYIDSVCLFVNE